MKRFVLASVVLALVFGGIHLANATMITNPVVIEDFEDGSISEYTGVGASSSNWVVSASAAHDGAFGLATTSGFGQWIFRNDAAVSLGQGDIFSSWVHSSNLDGRAYFGFGSSSTGTYSMVLAPNTTNVLLQRNSGFGFLNIGATSFGWTANKWYLFEVDWSTGGNITGRVYDSDGTTLLTSVAATDNTFTSGGIAFRGFSGTKQFDTVTKQGVIPEPSTYLLFGIGILGIIGMGYRRRKKAV